MGIGFMKHAYMNEILAWSRCRRPLRRRRPRFRQPDHPHQVRHRGTEEALARTLHPRRHPAPLLHDRARRPGSDPYAIQTRAIRDGDDWVINGRKWFTSGRKGSAFAIVMCRTEEVDGAGGTRDKMTQIIVPDRYAGLQHRPQRPGLGPRLEPLRDRVQERARPGRRTSSGARAPATRPPRTASAPAASSTA